MATQDRSLDNHVEVIVAYESNRRRLWLPADQPVHFLIDAMRQKSEDIFGKEMPEGRYSLVSTDEKGILMGDGYSASKTFAELRIRHNMTLALRQEQVRELRFRTLIHNRQQRLFSGNTIGFMRSDQTHNAAMPTLNLAKLDLPFTENTPNTPEFAQVAEDSQGNYHLRVLYTGGILVNNHQRKEDGEIIKLEHGMLLTIGRIYLQALILQMQN